MSDDDDQTPRRKRRTTRKIRTRRLGLKLRDVADQDEAMPRAGALGWLALHVGLVTPQQMRRALQQQQGDDAQQQSLGAMLRDAGVLDDAQIEQLLALQTTWRELSSAHGLDDQHAELLIQLLEVRGELTIAALERCRDAPPIGPDGSPLARVQRLIVAAGFHA